MRIRSWLSRRFNSCCIKLKSNHFELGYNMIIPSLISLNRQLQDTFPSVPKHFRLIFSQHSSPASYVSQAALEKKRLPLKFNARELKTIRRASNGKKVKTRRMMILQFFSISREIFDLYSTQGKESNCQIFDPWRWEFALDGVTEF